MTTLLKKSEVNDYLINCCAEICRNLEQLELKKMPRIYKAYDDMTKAFGGQMSEEYYKENCECYDLNNIDSIVHYCTMCFNKNEIKIADSDITVKIGKVSYVSDDNIDISSKKFVVRVESYKNNRIFGWTNFIFDYTNILYHRIFIDEDEKFEIIQDPGYDTALIMSVCTGHILDYSEYIVSRNGYSVKLLANRSLID